VTKLSDRQLIQILVGEGEQTLRTQVSQVVNEFLSAAIRKTPKASTKAFWRARPISATTKPVAASFMRISVDRSDG
jgi:hypothetical protein